MTGNIHAAWFAMLLGALAGAAQGLMFHREDWAGGYASWRRRLMRLGHVSLFGLGLVNLAFASSVRLLGLDERSVVWSSRLLILALITMPLVCYGSAFVQRLRHLFFVPVSSVIVGLSLFLREMLAR